MALVPVCDFDNTLGAAKHKLVLDGREVEIDLCNDCFTKVAEAVKPCFDTGKVKDRAAANGNGVVKGEIGEIRAWAQANGHEVGQKGRIPADVLAAYEVANAK